MILQRKFLLSLVSLSSFLTLSSIWAQGEPRFQTTANAADVITPVGGKGAIGVGFYTETIYPLNRPYSSDTGSLGGGQEDMRFQVPLGFGLEGSYGFTRRIEGALSVGFDYFKTQNFRDFGAGGTKVYDEAKYRLYPVMGIVRYRFPMKWMTPEIEAAVGAAFGSIKITAYKQPRESVEEKGPFYRGHLAVGTGFAWGEGASLHLQVGYAVNQLGKKTYTYASDGYTVEQKDYLQGVFTKAFLKFYF
jgi:hypothetical protein